MEGRRSGGIPASTGERAWGEAMVLGLACLVPGLLTPPELVPGGLALLSPVAGLALAALLMRPPRGWPLLLAAYGLALLASLAGATSLAAAVSIAGVSVLQAAAAAALVRRFVGARITLRSIREVVPYMALVLLGANLPGALLAAAIAEPSQGVGFREAVALWWVRDAVASLVVPPLFLLAEARDPADVRARRGRVATAERVLYGAALLGLGLWAFGAEEASPHGIGPRALAVLPLTAWGLLRLGPRAVAVGTAVFVLAALAPLVRALGAEGIDPADLVAALVERQNFLAVVAGTLLVGNGIRCDALRVQASLAAVNAGLEERVRDATLELKDSEERYRRLVELAPDAMIVHTDGRIVFLNPRACELFGFRQPEDAIGMEVIELVHPDDRERVRNRIRSVLAVGEVAPLVEQKLVLADGSAIHAEVTGTRVQHEGRPSVLVAIRDVSARKQAEWHQARLLDELDHRVKNTLGTVLALAEETADEASSLEGFLDTISRRLHSLARAHEVLAGVRWADPRLAEVARAVLEPFGVEGQIEIHGDEPVYVPSRAAQPVALVLNELATNSLKHGALARGRDGRVRLDIELRGNAVRLRWTESGRPVGTAPVHAGTGTGTGLIRSLVEIELGGSVRTAIEPEGLRCEIGFPAQPGGVDGEPEERADPEWRLEPPPSLAGRRLLVVEDDLMQSRHLVRMLDRIGCDVVGTATTVEEGLALARSTELDGAVLDLDLKGVSSVPIAIELRGRSKPVLFVTGFGSEALLPETLADVPRLAKPVDRSRLFEALARSMRG